ncbi:uncharacterized protein B0H18DRAFT_976240 [Fomitopsis serialis]|uniref:uncharacterized protein n=1 Tax=Fomitopsis serialis TaxID=139415 RepID=UPI002007BD6E|nr:uncharacterized protein B0H18DRAFT_976240 [Neoantrodia serialis]KAH9935556.1 hypothetical protein B0H18DRAFT_976240 [Neoantrodia serialis]
MIAVISIGIANMLVLLRVVILWDERPSVLKFMVVAYCASLIAQVTTIILTLLQICHLCAAGVTWSPIAGMCVSSQSSHVIVAVWASPMLFELFVLVSTALNAVDRPTSARTPIARALCSDAFSIGRASLSRPSFTLLGVFFREPTDVDLALVERCIPPRDGNRSNNSSFDISKSIE